MELVTSESISKKEFEKLSDKYFSVVDSITDIMQIHKLNIDEALIILDSLTQAMTVLKLQGYVSVEDLINTK